MRLFLYDTYIVNLDNDQDAERILKDPDTKRELTQEEITKIFGDKAHLAGQGTTKVDDKGNITFTLPKYYTELPSWLDTIVRPERDRKLAASDKYMTMDYPISQATRDQWATYRQVLRELPKVLTKITDPIPWPAEPA